MGRTACTEPQCLYEGALYRYLLWSCWPLPTTGRVRSQATLCRILGGRRGTRTGLFPSTSVSSCQQACHSTVADHFCFNRIICHGRDFLGRCTGYERAATGSTVTHLQKQPHGYIHYTHTHRYIYIYIYIYTHT